MSKRLFVVLSIVAFAAAAVHADQGKSQGRGKDNKSGGTSVSVAFVFNDTDRTTFRNYFVSHKIVAQPLPPGIAKNVARGKPLPPGIAKKGLPADLVLTLGPRVQPGVTFAIYGDRVVALRSGLVIDVMIGIFK
ncbi:MAG TPA: hypothetical protein VN700_07050 [Vicinamibacterales bacterium]|nr:hypothetical protein [Vicinamibacterales bacterium]